jgi:outer membrane protein insertion porin family/translocation and assembly module TamA
VRRAAAARLTRVFLLIASLAALSQRGAAQGYGATCESEDFEVRGVSFEGNHQFRSSDLSRVIVTSPSSWFRRVLSLPIGGKRCLDTLEVRRDAFRIRVFYRQRGYWRTDVTSNIRPVDKKAVKVEFAINEGPPVILDTLSITGLDSVPNAANYTRDLRNLRGKVFSRIAMNAAIDSTLERLRNNGYARADNLYSQEVSVDNLATVTVQFLPGRPTYIGAIRFDIRPNHEGGEVRIAPNDVRKLLSFETGDLYRLRDLLRSQQRLYQRETYRNVEISLDPPRQATGDTTPAAHPASGGEARVPADSLTADGGSATHPAPPRADPGGTDTSGVTARLVEADMHSVRLGAGWATLDCFRTQARFVHRNFLGGARRLELSARLSKIGVGAPLDGFPGLCTNSVRNDPFSTRLNYYLGATFRPPTFFGPKNVLALTAFSERRSDFNAFLREAPIGALASVTHELAASSLNSATLLSLGYRFELGTTQAAQAVFCEVFNFCDIADIDELGQQNELQVVSLAFDRYKTDLPIDPTRGSRLNLAVSAGRNAVGTQSTNYTKLNGDLSVYRRVLSSSVLAMHLRLGAINDAFSLHPETQYVPPDERLYAGGPESVRGFQQNELGPVVYVVNQFHTCTATTTAPGCPSGLGPTDTILVVDPNDPNTRSRFSPTGGNGLVVANVELRMPSPLLGNLLRVAVFVDAGQLWNRGFEAIHLGDIRVTPGAGIRVPSPVGPFRLDVAFNGYAARSGASYFVPTTGENRSLLCVSPGNTLQGGRPTGPNTCPATFAPTNTKSFIQKLTFHFSLGQAF